ncbi:MAG: riboflavin kinase [Patescibacteria group bacterium]
MDSLPVLFQFEGVVASGRGKGRLLGYPTANVPTHRAREFSTGVYAGWAEVSGRRYLSAVIIGAPGLNDCCEVYLLDFQGNLYGERLQCTVVAKIREMSAFTDSEKLRAQIEEDLSKIRAMLKQP